ncbi:GMC family oxidoreductase N-terminal domain-containing protein [Modestobacter sp. DSM 44400]|uniref:GMC family oxidoreductase N-terminal domain-containing protein n=1 Tax=Modestobacter sp. DSM 44400 TaxID=1550230 RepID=UPI00352B45E5
MWRTRRDWNYATDPQPGLAGRQLFWPRGKLLGGSSSINAMSYIRGAAADYDEWAQLTGDDASSYANVLPLFRRGEDDSRAELTSSTTPRAAAVGEPALPAPLDPRRRRVRRRGRVPAQRRIQRREAGGRGHLPGDPAAGTALVGR